MSIVEYHWDHDKAQRNLQNHGIRFADAVSVFQDDAAITIDDTVHSDIEDRYITIGINALGQILVVVYTWRGNSIRLITARKATPGERKTYEAGYGN